MLVTLLAVMLASASPALAARGKITNVVNAGGQITAISSAPGTTGTTVTIWTLSPVRGTVGWRRRKGNPLLVDVSHAKVIWPGRPNATLADFAVGDTVDTIVQRTSDATGSGA